MKTKHKFLILLMTCVSTCHQSTHTMMAEALKKCNVDSAHDICNAQEECLAISGTTDHRCVPIEGRKPEKTMNEALKGCNVESGYAICNANEECLQIGDTNYHRCVPIEGRTPSVT